MQIKIDNLEHQLQEIRSKITIDTFEQWLRSKATKALILQLMVDEEDLKENWSHGTFNEEESLRAQGQSQYIIGLINIIPDLGPTRDA